MLIEKSSTSLNSKVEQERYQHYTDAVDLEDLSIIRNLTGEKENSQLL